MRGDAETGRDRTQGGGVRVTPLPTVRGRVWLLVAALGLAALVLVMAVRPLLRAPVEPGLPEGSRSARPAVGRDPAPGAAVARGAAAVPPGVRLERLPGPPEVEVRSGDPEAAGVPVEVVAEDAVAKEEVVDDAESGDTPRGIALFPPPGTDPPKSGILVPDDFPLPPGYVRHFQATDDGKPLAAILMFHPDYQLVDERGEPIAMPEDRVVPPDMAPPGLAIEMLEVPDTQIPMMEVPEEQSAQDPPS